MTHECDATRKVAALINQIDRNADQAALANMRLTRRAEQAEAQVAALEREAERLRAKVERYERRFPCDAGCAEYPEEDWQDWQDGIECVSVPLDDVRAVLSGAGVSDRYETEGDDLDDTTVPAQADDTPTEATLLVRRAEEHSLQHYQNAVAWRDRALKAEAATVPAQDDDTLREALHALLDSDAMTANTDGTPTHYIIEAENVEYLVGIVLRAARGVVPSEDPANRRSQAMTHECDATRKVAAVEARLTDWEDEAHLLAVADVGAMAAEIRLVLASVSGAGVSDRATTAGDDTPTATRPLVFVDKATGEPCPTRDNRLCTILDEDHLHVSSAFFAPPSAGAATVPAQADDTLREALAEVLAEHSDTLPDGPDTYGRESDIFGCLCGRWSWDSNDSEADQRWAEHKADAVLAVLATRGVVPSEDPA